jgi:hypothetical protein
LPALIYWDWLRWSRWIAQPLAQSRDEVGVRLVRPRRLSVQCRGYDLHTRLIRRQSAQIRSPLCAHALDALIERVRCQDLFAARRAQIFPGARGVGGIR